jgi:hypothetical protein
MKTKIVITKYDKANAYGNVLDLVEFIMNKTQNYIKAKKILFDKYKIEIKLELV